VPELAYVPADTSQPLLDLTAGSLLRAAAAEVPDTVALVEISAPDGPPLVAGAATGTRTWTYAALLDEAETTADWLAERFAPGERVCVWAPNVAEWVVLQYGAALAGLVLVTANPALRAPELRYVLEQSGAVGLAYVDAYRGTDMAAIVDEIVGDTPVRELIRIADWETTVRAHTRHADRVLPEVAPTDPAQIQYTSGTTGFPKGAVLHHRGLITNARDVHRRAGFPAGGVWATGLPMFHTAGCGMSVLGSATSRATLVILQTFDPTLALQAMQAWKADLFGGVPAMFAAILAFGRPESYDLSSVKVTASGGDAVPAPMAQAVEAAFGSRFTTVYGQTELSPIIAQTSPGDPDDKRLHTTGRALWNVELKIVDPLDGRTVERGERGEICARGDQAMLGYHEMPEATAATIDADGWVHTGDLGTIDAEGYLVVTGRLKDMIIRGGENIYPREVEDVLRSHAAVADVAVLGRPDERWGETVAAVIVPAGEAAVSVDALRALVREQLAPHKTPQHWYVVDALPANAMGKIQKFKLRDSLDLLTPAP
jgi:fatty-acyl-CoA synthase